MKQSLLIEDTEIEISSDESELLQTSTPINASENESSDVDEFSSFQEDTLQFISSDLSYNRPIELKSPDIATSQSVEVSTTVTSISDILTSHCDFKIVLDNINANVTPRYLTSEQQTTSHNYVQMFAVKDRVDFSKISRVHRQLPPQLLPKQIADAVLPSTIDDSSLKKHFITIVSRILVTHLSFFTLAFEDVTEWHILHKFYKEMSQKSEVVSISKSFAYVVFSDSCM